MTSQTNQNPQDDDWGPLSGLPGNPMMWLLIASELAVFSAVLVGFTAARIFETDVFMASQDHLNRLAGAINTMVLLTSGLFGALAVRSQIEAKGARARLFLVASMVLGLVFLVIKWSEYSAKFDAGINTDTDTFFMFFFLATGFHALHVVFGIVILAIVAWKNSVDNVVTGVAFWHMVDLIWVILFPVIYLMR